MRKKPKPVEDPKPEVSEEKLRDMAVRLERSGAMC
jgi:hypothetical protein